MAKSGIISNKPSIEEWEEDLSEYGQLHNEDCCVNFEDSRSCSSDIGFVDCCDNMVTISTLIRQHRKAVRLNTIDEVLACAPKKKIVEGNDPYNTTDAMNDSYNNGVSDFRYSIRKIK